MTIQEKIMKNIESKGLWAICAIGILIAFSYFLAADMYVPSMPSIVSDFNSSNALVRLSIPFFLVTLAISQLLYGPASDKYGRKPILLVGATFYCVGSLICLLSMDIEFLLLGRIFQGLGAGALMSLSRTIIQDSASKEKFVEIVGWLSLFFMLAPSTAPLLGGIIETYTSWRVTFLVMLIFIVCLILLIIFVLPETHRKDRRNEDALKLTHLRKNYKEILTHMEFIVYTLCMVAGLSGIVVFYTIGPFIFIQKLGFSAQSFGLISLLIIGCAFVARLYMSIVSLPRFGAKKTMMTGLVMTVFASFLLLFTVLTGASNAYNLIICISLYSMGSSLVSPVAVGTALSFFKHLAGSAGAMYGFLQMFSLFLISMIASLVAATVMSLAIILVCCSVSALLLFYYTVFSKRDVLAASKA
ncbi:multidrug effflux MFS transporter [Fangia hongkongensis]|uniref:multidrug effflux MFS transporter n=1 Tax=Fangia hongkongensis TaxID=270495 RepID=UPI0003AA0187|nr:multidrug effflux MFS transporter [Fangia hongkongensis]MBK2123942.1 multidrug effflux MFS transporter [Fangia hongkongensis]